MWYSILHAVEMYTKWSDLITQYHPGDGEIKLDPTLSFLCLPKSSLRLWLILGIFIVVHIYCVYYMYAWPCSEPPIWPRSFGIYGTFRLNVLCATFGWSCLLPSCQKKQNPPQDSRLKSAKDLNIQHSPTQSNSATPHTNKKTSSKTGPKKINPHSCLINILYHQKVRIKKCPVSVGKKQIGNNKNPHRVAPRTPHRILPAGELQSFLSLHLLRNLHLARSRRPAISSSTPFVWNPIKMTPDFCWYFCDIMWGQCKKILTKNSQTSAIASTQYSSGTWGISFIIKPSVAYATAPDTSWVSG